MSRVAELLRTAGPVGLSLTLALWLGVDSGPWVLRGDSTGFVATLHYVRTLLPLAVGGLAVLVLLVQGGTHRAHGEDHALPVSLRLWGIYAVLAAVGCTRSSRPEDALYWAGAYAAVLLASWATLAAQDVSARVSPLQGLNVWTWLIALVLLGALVTVSRGRLIVESTSGVTGYGVVGRVGEVGGMVVSRASGFARFAASLAVVTLVLCLRGTAWQRLFWGSMTLVTAALVYLFQSRGAIIGLAVAASFLLVVQGGRLRVASVFVLATVLIGVFSDVVPRRVVDRVESHLTRGQSEQELRSLTGRTRAWRAAVSVIEENPWLGSGPQADRYLIGEHVHNTVLYAWLTAGLFGALAIVGGFGLAWRDMIRALRRGESDGRTTRTLVLIAAGLLVFFTVRGIPEVSGAMFGVDLLMLVPALALLGSVGRRWVPETVAEPR